MVFMLELSPCDRPDHQDIESSDFFLALKLWYLDGAPRVFSRYVCALRIEVSRRTDLQVAGCRLRELPSCKASFKRFANAVG